MSIFVCWKDYNGSYVEEFQDRTNAENRIGEILFKDDDYGTQILLIVRGQKLIYRETVKVKAIELEVDDATLLPQVS